MERLKSLIPDEIRRMIAESAPDDLNKTSTLILDFLRHSPQFRQVIRELNDPEFALCRKSKEAALDSKQKGNECFQNGDYAKALTFYNQALRDAPSADMDTKLITTLYVNRASTLHNLGLQVECIRDCNRAIIVSPNYVKAWYRRGKANASLNNYETARCDLEVAFTIEDSLSQKSHIQKEIDLLGSEFGIGNSSSNTDEENEDVDATANSYDIVLECVSTSFKGRGMASKNNIPSGSLIHREQPLAAILLKTLRESHCHFCFNEAPADVLFCPSCTIPIYCSNHCQEQAGGKQSVRSYGGCAISQNLTADIEKHVKNVLANSIRNIGEALRVNEIPEHQHECGGANWSSVLPSDVVMAGRVMMRITEERSSILGMVHHYEQNSPVSKLEMHIFAVVLFCCLNHHDHLDIPSSERYVAQLILLLCQIKVNSMAVVHMKSLDQDDALRKSPKISSFVSCVTSGIKQVRVGQAIYSTGSLFNHSCRPNVHAYFLSRTLHLRSTESVTALYPLELSYGPQVGELDLQHRQKFLREQYHFQCKCSGCSEVNLSDIVINAFHCTQPFCIGVVLQMTQYQIVGDNFVEVSSSSYNSKLSLPLSHTKMEVSKVAQMLLDRKGVKEYLAASHCLNCGSFGDLESSAAISNSSMAKIQRVKDSIPSIDSRDVFVSDLLSSLGHLKAVRHPYSKIVAQAEDNLAEAFVKIGEFKMAVQHCSASIEILEKLYHREHIVIGHELMKLASIQSSLGDHTGSLSSIRRAEGIFSVYYGSHMDKVFPFVNALKREAEVLAASS